MPGTIWWGGGNSNINKSSQSEDWDGRSEEGEMGKWFLSGLLIVFGTFGNFQAAYAQTKGSELVVPDKAAEKKRAEMRKRIEERKKELNGGEWEVMIKSMSGKGALDGSDALTFQDNVFRSKSSAKLGFTSTNYTLTVSDSGEGPTVWETMQTSGKGNVMFWRGEWLGDKMTGVISRQLEDGKSEEYSFSSSSMKEIPETSESEESAGEVKDEKSTDKNLSQGTLKSEEAGTIKGKKKKK